MKTLKHSLAAVICAALALCAAARPAVAESPIYERETLPAAGITSLVLEGANGSARIVTGADDEVRIEVRLSPKQWSDEKPFRAIRKWFLSSSYDEVGDLLGAIRIASDSRPGGTLRLGLTPAGSSREDKISEEWTVVVPARLAVTLRMSSAEIEVSGVAGGVEVSAGHGSVEVDVPEGDLDIRLTVGNVKVTSGSRSVGKVDLQSSVGSTRLWLDGMRFKYPSPPGPGSRVSASGRGDDVVRIDVEVGDISADVGGEGGAR